MKTVLLVALFVFITNSSWASCGPPECCSHPHRCGNGPEVEKFPATHAVCMENAARSVDGKAYPNPAGYPVSIKNDLQEEMASLIWSDGLCYVKYSRGYFRP